MALPAFSRSRLPASPASPSQKKLLRTIEVWESNHRLMAARLSEASRRSTLRGCYLRWALLEIEMLYNKADRTPSDETKATLQAAWNAAGDAPRGTDSPDAPALDDRTSPSG